MYLSNRNKYKVYYLFYIDKTTNKLKKVTTRTKLKSEAIEFLRTFKPDKDGEEKEKVILNCSFKELREKILAYTSQNYTPCTNQIYRNTTNNFLKIVGDKPLNKITINDIEYFKAERLKNVNRVTANIDIRTLKAIFKHAIRWNMLKESPCQYVEFYMVNEKEKLNFEDIDIKKLLDIIDKDKIKNIVLLAMYTGCRISEILNIQWQDIDFGERVITIRNKPSFKTKSGRIRKIPISDKLLIILDKLYKGNEETEDKIYNLHNPEDYLFTNERGINYRYTYITMQFKKYLRMAEIDEKYHFHCLRHTFISNLIKKGVNINYVMEIAGHSDISTTMNYIHIVTEDLRDAVNMI